jgi:hypothetical protein
VAIFESGEVGSGAIPGRIRVTKKHDIEIAIILRGTANRTPIVMMSQRDIETTIRA